MSGRRDHPRRSGVGLSSCALDCFIPFLGLVFNNHIIATATIVATFVVSAALLIHQLIACCTIPLNVD